MREIRRTAALLLALAALFSACGPAAAAKKKNSDYQINDKNKPTFIELLDRLKTAYETPAEDDSGQIDALVEQITGVNADDGDIARAVAEHWKAVFLDPGYRLCVWWGKEKANELAATKPDYDEKHAFVVLGYQLKNGEMADDHGGAEGPLRRGGGGGPEFSWRVPDLLRRADRTEQSGPAYRGRCDEAVPGQ